MRDPGQKEGGQWRLSRDACATGMDVPATLLGSARVHWLGRSPQLIAYAGTGVQRGNCSSGKLV